MAARVREQASEQLNARLNYDDEGWMEREAMDLLVLEVGPACTHVVVM